MKVIYKIPTDFMEPMETYREWTFSPRIQETIERLLTPQDFKRATGEEKTSERFLMGIDHEKHDGLPGDFLGINLNSKVIRKHVGDFDGAFIEEARVESERLDEDLQHLLGAKLCALKMFYPAGGYIDWHTNWDSPGYNVIFTYSLRGKGYWRHIDSEGANSVVPRLDRLVHIDDPPGWHCKVGYFGRKQETDRLVWHSAYTEEPRLTLSYIIEEKSLWENLVEELSEG